MRAYSLDLRQRIVAALKDGQKERQVADRFDVSVSSVQRYDRLERQQHSLQPKTAPGKKPTLSKEQEPEFRAMLAQSSDWTLAKMSLQWQRKAGFLLPKSTVHDLVQRLGYHYKKRASKPKNALPRNEPPSSNR